MLVLSNQSEHSVVLFGFATDFKLRRPRIVDGLIGVFHSEHRFPRLTFECCSIKDGCESDILLELWPSPLRQHVLSASSTAHRQSASIGHPKPIDLFKGTASIFTLVNLPSSCLESLPWTVTVSVATNDAMAGAHGTANDDTLADCCGTISVNGIPTELPATHLPAIHLSANDSACSPTR